MISSFLANRLGSLRISTALISGQLRPERTDRLYSLQLITPRRRKCPGRDPVWTRSAPAPDLLRNLAPAERPWLASRLDIEIP